jgi:hypothetical protein
MKIAILIPSTSKGRDEWKDAKDTYLYKHTFKTLLLTYDDEHEYRFYIGIDRGDRIYDNPAVKLYFEKMASIMKNTSIEFMYMTDIKKGHLTVMWNRLFEKAFDDGHDYFFQCGDDIVFETKGWINESIRTLEASDGIGMTGPINNNPRILTQSFVSRRHMELFGYYFPPEIINWCCDDWINDVYKRVNHFYPLQEHRCNNVGGAPRYDINNDPFFVTSKFQDRLSKLRIFATRISEIDAIKIAEKLKEPTSDKI